MFLPAKQSPYLVKRNASPLNWIGQYALYRRDAMSKIVITLEDKEIELIQMIVNDNDKDDALDFVKDVIYRKVNDAKREKKCGPNLQ
jgi:hypothetical protein